LFLLHQVKLGGVRKRRSIPVALTIAGSDSGGGAGIQADLKTFESLGVHGTSAITCVTAQNPKTVLGIQPCGAEILCAQIEAVFAELRPAAVKTGMLYSEPIIGLVVEVFKRRGRPPLVVDPVMISTSGVRLLKPRAIGRLQSELLPLATLVTPNLHEAELLVNGRLRSVDDLRAAARLIQREYGCAALVKGGHLEKSREAVDVFYDGARERLLRGPFIKGIRLHGAGCTYSAAITGYLARGAGLARAVTLAKQYISGAIAGSLSIGRHSQLNHSWKPVCLCVPRSKTSKRPPP
jgi:hydroxymethylpyrimidine/phosphomethylpyrimidine kinase